MILPPATNHQPTVVVIGQTVGSRYKMDDVCVEDGELLSSLEAAVGSKREIALLRIRLLDADRGGAGLGVPALVVKLLGNFLKSFLEAIQIDSSTFAIATKTGGAHDQYKIARGLLLRLLRVHLTMNRSDPTLGEELGRQGSHALLLKLMQYEVSHIASDAYNSDEIFQDAVMELQDVACEITTHCKKFPERVQPFSVEELKSRLPLIFQISAVRGTSQDERESRREKEHVVLIHQVTARQSAQDDVGFGRWHSMVCQWTARTARSHFHHTFASSPTRKSHVAICRGPFSLDRYESDGRSR